MNPVMAWHEEHAYFGRLLLVLQEEVDRLYAGSTPNYELVLDIISYLRDYSDQVHHPREDEAFKRLARHSPELRPILVRLHQEHRVIAQSGDRLRELVEEAASDAVVSRADIEAAASTYIVYYRTTSTWRKRKCFRSRRVRSPRRIGRRPGPSRPRR